MKNNFELKCRKIVESDWEYLPKWWEAYPGWKGNSIPREMLPGTFEPKMGMDITEEDEKTLGLGGFMVHKDETMIAACWLTLTNSKMAMVAPVVANPEYRDTDRADAIGQVIHFTSHVAYDLGYSFAHAWSIHDNLTNIYKILGYASEQAQELTIKL